MPEIKIDLLKDLAKILESQADVEAHFKKFHTKYKFNFHNDLV